MPLFCSINSMGTIEQLRSIYAKHFPIKSVHRRPHGVYLLEFNRKHRPLVNGIEQTGSSSSFMLPEQAIHVSYMYKHHSFHILCPRAKRLWSIYAIAVIFGHVALIVTLNTLNNQVVVSWLNDERFLYIFEKGFHSHR